MFRQFKIGSIILIGELPSLYCSTRISYPYDKGLFCSKARMKQAPHPLRLQEGAEGEAARVCDILISTRASFYKY